MHQPHHLPFDLGAFRATSFLGTGGMADVWRAVHRGSGTQVALKVARAASSVALAENSLIDEARAMAGLDHPNVVRIFDYGSASAAEAALSGGSVTPGAEFLAMEFASRGSLVELRRPLTWRDVAAIARGVLRGLAHAHAHGVIHRDVKPSNILLGASDDGRPGLKLADFGIAYSERTRRPSRPGADHGDSFEEAIGTPWFMAPEQFFGRWRDFGPATDIYALGAVVWELLCGDPPFVGDSPFAIGAQHVASELPAFTPLIATPPGVEALLRRMLAKAPADRPRSAPDVLRALGHLAAPDSAGSSGVASARTSDAASARSIAAAGLGVLAIRPTPLLGRGRELGALTWAVASVGLTAQPFAQVVRGPQGAGVAELVESFGALEAQAGTATVHTIRDGAELGFGLFVADYCRANGLSGDDRNSRVSDGLRRLGLPESVIELLTGLAARHHDEPGTSMLPLSADERDAIDRFFRVTSQLTPFVVVAPRARQLPGWIRTYVEGAGPGDAAVVFVLGVEGEFGPIACDGISLDHIDLPPVPDETVAEVLEALLPLEPALQRTIVAHAAGLPGRAVAALRALTVAGRLAPGGDGFRLVPQSRGPVAPAGDLGARP